jgi:hypothetical protein
LTEEKVNNNKRLQVPATILLSTWMSLYSHHGFARTHAHAYLTIL